MSDKRCKECGFLSTRARLPRQIKPRDADSIVARLRALRERSVRRTLALYNNEHDLGISESILAYLADDIIDGMSEDGVLL